MAILIFGCMIPLVLIASGWVLRWWFERQPSSDGRPVAPEDLAREEPVAVVVDISYEYFEPLLEQIEGVIDWGMTREQCASLLQRVTELHPGEMTNALFPVRYDGTVMDVQMLFGRLGDDALRCRFQSEKVLISRIGTLLKGIPQQIAPQF